MSLVDGSQQPFEFAFFGILAFLELPQNVQPWLAHPFLLHLHPADLFETGITTEVVGFITPVTVASQGPEFGFLVIHVVANHFSGIVLLRVTAVGLALQAREAVTLGLPLGLLAPRALLLLPLPAIAAPLLLPLIAAPLLLPLVATPLLLPLVAAPLLLPLIAAILRWRLIAVQVLLLA